MSTVKDDDRDLTRKQRREQARTSNNFGFTGTPSFALGNTGGPVRRFETESHTDPASFVTTIRRLEARQR